MEITNVLNLNRNQIAAIKRSYQNNKSLYNRIKAKRAKIEALGEEFKDLVKQTEAWEAPVKAMTKASCGVELTSEQVLVYLANPEKFSADYPSKTLPEQSLNQGPAVEQ